MPTEEEILAEMQALRAAVGTDKAATERNLVAARTNAGTAQRQAKDAASAAGTATTKATEAAAATTEAVAAKTVVLAHVDGVVWYPDGWTLEQVFPAGASLVHLGTSYRALLETQGVEPGTDPQTWMVILEVPPEVAEAVVATGADRVVVEQAAQDVAANVVVVGQAAVQVGEDKVAVEAAKVVAEDAASAAAARAAAALAAEEAAAAAAAAAELSAAAAEAYGTLYASTTAGLAATVDGEFFLVVGDGTNSYALLYENESEVATLRATYPSKTALDTAIAGIGTRVSVYEAALPEEDDGKLRVDAGLKAPVGTESTYVEVVSDDAGRILIGVDKATGKAFLQLTPAAVALLGLGDNPLFAAVDERFAARGGDENRIAGGFQTSDGKRPLAITNDGTTELWRTNFALPRGIETSLLPLLADSRRRILLGIDRTTGEFRLRLDQDSIDRIASRLDLPGLSVGLPIDLDLVPETIGFDEVHTPVRYAASAARFLGAEDSGDPLTGYVCRTDIAATTVLAETGGPILMVPWAGESLAVGASGGVVTLGTAPMPRHLMMFDDGLGTRGIVRGDDVGPFDPETVTDFIPARETVWASFPTYAETPITSMMRWLDAKLVAAGKRRRTMVGRSHGAGGRTIAELLPGQRPFENGLGEIGRAVEIAALYGRDIEVKAVPFTQGANDRGVTSRANYLSRLGMLVDGYQSSIPALTGQASPPLVMIDQHGAASDNSPGGAGASEVALAQLDAVEAETVVGVVAKYALEYLDEVHLTALAYDILGEYHALAYYTLFFTNAAEWKTCRVLDVQRSGAVITLTVELPEGGALFSSTADLPQADNEGFVYSDSGGTIEIASVAITGDDEITITLTGDPVANENRTLSYAYQGGPGDEDPHAGTWGNIYSTSVEDSIADPGRKLHHPLWVFSKSVP